MQNHVSFITQGELCLPIWRSFRRAMTLVGNGCFKVSTSLTTASMNSNDDFSYQSLAMLYLDWAKRAKSEEESSEYITKCEQVITDGLRSVKDREALWVVSSEVRRWLGNQPSRIEKLKNAVSESATSGVILRYHWAGLTVSKASPKRPWLCWNRSFSRGSMNSDHLSNTSNP